MKKIFVDTNILLDIFLKRQPFYVSAQEIWMLAERKQVQAAISAISINNIFFIIRKLSSMEKAYMAVETLMEVFHLVTVDELSLRKAMKAHFTDFEDGIQYYSALTFKANVLVSRDGSGFSKSSIPVMNATEYLALYHEE